jgi:membrane protease subunit HflK
MTQVHAHTGPPSHESGGQGPLDPANQSLADALRKSFRILKLIMLVLVVLYFLSGWFSVKPSEVGVVLRFGRIVGTGPQEPAFSAVLPPGWHWSWPYPFERWATVSANEREMPVEFLFQLSDEERTGGIKGYKYNNLSPARDDYLITGDANILHASLVVKYRIGDAVAYLSNVLPMPDLEAGPRSPAFKRYPEYTLLSNLVRNAVIDTAAGREALQIRGTGQDEFLLAVARRLNEKLKGLEKSGLSLGIEVDPNNGVLAPKSSTIEAIMPPRQVQEVFDRTFAAQTGRSVTITKAASAAQALLLQTAGTGYEDVAAAVKKEYGLMLELAAAESGRAETETAPAQPPGGADSSTSVARDVAALREALRNQRQETESLLEQCSGDVQTIMNNARIKRDEIIKEAAGDYARFLEVLPEYVNNPEIFVSRFLDDMYARALHNKGVAKVFVPPEAREWRLYIPRSAKAAGSALQEEKEKGKTGSEQPTLGSRSTRG